MIRSMMATTMGCAVEELPIVVSIVMFTRPSVKTTLSRVSITVMNRIGPSCVLLAGCPRLT